METLETSKGAKLNSYYRLVAIREVATEKIQFTSVLLERQQTAGHAGTPRRGDGSWPGRRKNDGRHVALSHIRDRS